MRGGRERLGCQRTAGACMNRARIETATPSLDACRRRPQVRGKGKPLLPPPPPQTPTPHPAQAMFPSDETIVSATLTFPAP